MIKKNVCIVDTQQADYQVISSITYRATGVVSRSCLPMYQNLTTEYYANINNILTERCSSLNVNMNVSVIKSLPFLIEENVLRVRNKLYNVLSIINTGNCVIMEQ